MEIKMSPTFSVSASFLKELKNNPENFYKERTQAKIKFGREQVDKNGSVKTRDIARPIYPLKFKQWEINDPLQKIQLPSSMHGGIKGRNNIQNAQKHIDSKFFLTIDLKKFFGNISYKHVYQTLINIGFNYKDARIITKLTTFKGSLPQGAPSSTVIANLVFSATAIELEKLCEKKGIVFTNFVDDLAFSAKKDFKYLVPEILELLKKNNFFINHKKIHYRRSSSEITGLFIKNNKMHLEKNMLQNLNNRGVRAYIRLVNEYNVGYSN
jgi:RNA-directed DNA polymerase